MLQVFQKFLTSLFERPMLSSTALDVLLDIVGMLKYHLYLVFTLQNNNTPRERLEAACRLIHGSGGHGFLWSLISALAPPGRTGSGIETNRKWVHTAILRKKLQVFPAKPGVSFGKTTSEKLVIKRSL